MAAIVLSVEILMGEPFKVQTIAPQTTLTII